MIEKKKLKTTGQAIDYLNEAVLGKDPDYPAVAREYEGVEPLQDRIGGIEQVDRDITDRLDVIENLDRNISDQLANKADKSQVAQDLALKADTSVVEGQLALKADKTELAPKADITYVDSELANKLDASNAESIIGVTTQADVVNGNSTPKLVSGKVIKDYTATKVDAVQLQDALSYKVDKTTKVNSKPLSSDIEIEVGDIAGLETTINTKADKTNVKTAIDELASDKADKLVLTNLIDNGDLTIAKPSPNENVPLGFTYVNATDISLTNGIAKFTATEQYSRLMHYFETNTGDKLYVFSRYKSNSSLVKLRLSDDTQTDHTGSGNFEYISMVNVSNGPLYIQINDYRSSGWTPIEVDYMGVINLTAVFGAGNEPSKEQMDAIIQTKGSFQTTDITIKDLMILLVKQSSGGADYEGLTNVMYPPEEENKEQLELGEIEEEKEYEQRRL